MSDEGTKREADLAEAIAGAPSHPRPPGSWHRRSRWLIGGALALVALVAAAWIATAAIARSAVTAWVDSSGLTCETGTIRVDDPNSLDAEDDPTAIDTDNLLAIGLMAKGQHCAIAVQLRNGSPFPIDVGTVTYNGIGRWGGMRARYTVENGVRATFPQDGAEALVDGAAAIGTLRPGEQTTLHLYLEFNPQSCYVKGDTEWYPGSPTFSIRALGLPGTTESKGADWGFVSNGDSNDCQPDECPTVPCTPRPGEMCADPPASCLPTPSPSGPAANGGTQGT